MQPLLQHSSGAGASGGTGGGSLSLIHILGLIETVKKSGNADVISTGGPVAFALRYNTKNGITQNRDVRRALIMAVDRDTIVKQLLLGQAKTIASFQGCLLYTSRCV